MLQFSLVLNVFDILSVMIVIQNRSARGKGCALL